MSIRASAPRTGARARLRCRGHCVSARVAVIAFLVAAVLLAPRPAHPAGYSPGPSIRLLSQTPWVDPEGRFIMKLGVDGATGDAVLEVTLHERITGRIQFSEGLDGGDPGPVIDRRCGATLAGRAAALDVCRIAVADLGAGEVSVVLPIQDAGSDPTRITLGNQGVYPVRATLSGPGGEIAASITTHLIRLPDPDDDSPPLPVALLLPLAAPIALQPDGSSTLEPPARERIAAVAQALAANPEVGVVLVPSPETLVAIERAGEQEIIEGLEGRSSLARPYADLDPAAWEEAGLHRELRRQLEDGAQRSAAVLGTPADETTWLVEPTQGSEALGALARLGVQRVVVPEHLLAPLDEADFPLALDQPFEVPAGNSTLPALVADASLSSHAGASGDPVLDAHHVLADLSVLYFQRPGVERGLAMLLPAGDLDPTFLRTLLAGLGAGGVATSRSPEEILASAQPATSGGFDGGAEARPLVREILAEPPAELGSFPEQLRAARQDLALVSELLGDGGDEGADLLEELLRVSADRRLGDAQRRRYLDAPRLELDRIVRAVHAPDGLAVTLTAREGSVPIRLQNDLDQPLEVMVALRSDKLDFPAGNTVRTTLSPGENRLEIGVRTRASGAFPVDVVVSSPNGALTLTESRFTLRSTAVSGIGIALSAVAAIFLAVWWARHWRNGRRARRLMSPGRFEPTPPTEQDRILRELTEI